MIESIFGKIVSINNNDLVINVGPINLSILIPSSEKYLSLKQGDDIKICTFLNVKEDSLVLIGFLESNERELFQKLINVKGVGPKVAVKPLMKSNRTRSVKPSKRGAIGKYGRTMLNKTKRNTKGKYRMKRLRRY